MADAIVDVLLALLLLLSVVAGLLVERRGVGKNPPLSDEAKAAMRRFLDEQEAGRG
jgi:uncharacterized protein YneF (UPF0154 family)